MLPWAHVLREQCEPSPMHAHRARLQCAITEQRMTRIACALPLCCSNTSAVLCEIRLYCGCSCAPVHIPIERVRFCLALDTAAKCYSSLSAACCRLCVRKCLPSCPPSSLVRSRESPRGQPRLPWVTVTPATALNSRQSLMSDASDRARAVSIRFAGGAGTIRCNTRNDVNGAASSRTRHHTGAASSAPS